MKITHLSPEKFVQWTNQKGVIFEILPCKISNILIAECEEKIIEVWLGESPKRLQKEIENLYSNLKKDKTKNGTLVQKVLDGADDSRVNSLVMVTRGTDFQKQVWDTLLTISKAQTISYSDVAKKIGRPKTVRAVASAIGKNNIAYFVPCHRVVRADGAVGEYRWDKNVKSAFLKKENAGMIAGKN